MWKITANKWSTMAGSFSTSREAKIMLKMPEPNVTAHISASFHVTTKKCNYNVINVRDLLRELGILFDCQNNFIGWQDINLPMKLMDCKMRTYFTIQDSKNVRNATKRIKKMYDANYENNNLKKIIINLKYLNYDKQSLTLIL